MGHASKERIKEVKKSIVKQQELQELHRRDILQASQRVKQFRQQCAQDAQDMQRAGEAEEDTDAGLSLGTALSALDASRAIAEDAARKAALAEDFEAAGAL